jgi:hypothetical protein
VGVGLFAYGQKRATWMCAQGGALIAAVLSLALWGCGSGGASKIVASVDGAAITQSSLNHWLPFEARTSFKAVPLGPVPKGVLPDPPSYSACVAYLGSALGPLTSRSQSAQQRKAACAALLQQLRQKTLQFLIRYQWYTKELKEQGVIVSDNEVKRNIDHWAAIMRTRKGWAGPGKELQGNIDLYTRATGLSPADFVYFERYGLANDKVSKEVQAKPGPNGMVRAVAEFTAKWVARTSCQHGYVVPGCRQYHGAEPPL